MSQRTLTTHEVDDILDAAHRCDIDIQSYSGRCMYGEQCLAVVVPSINEYTAFILCVARNNYQLGELMSKNISQDDMGFDTVYYWSGIQWEDGNLCRSCDKPISTGEYCSNYCKDNDV